MLFCQVQIMIIIGIYLYCLNVVRSILTELKEMDVLADKDNGQLWNSAYDDVPPQAVQAILVSFSIVQLLLMAAILYYLFKFAQ